MKQVKDMSPETFVSVSSVISREDADMSEEINSPNTKLKSLCDSSQYGFIDNSNIDSSFLNRSKLHLNKRGDTLLAKNIKAFIENM